MRILLDEDVDVKVLKWLNSNGHDAVRVPSGLQNGRVIQLARREGRILLTRDTDFSNRLFYPPSQLLGIVILRIHPPRYEQLVAELHKLFANLAETDIQGKTVIVESHGYYLLT